MKVDEYCLKLYIFGCFFGLGFALIVFGWVFWSIFEHLSKTIPDISFFYPTLMLIIGVISLIIGILLPFVERSEPFKHEHKNKNKRRQ